MANVFAYRAGVLRTPSGLDGALEGITREAVLGIAQGLGIPTEVGRMGRLDLLGADEAFLTGTGIEIAAVRSLDGAKIGELAPGPFTAKLGVAFGELTRSSGTPL